jgi:hypothetical protein
MALYGHCQHQGGQKAEIQNEIEMKVACMATSSAFCALDVQGGGLILCEICVISSVLTRRRETTSARI